MAPVRIVVVEDHEQFRRLICSTLGKVPELQVVAEVSDGLAAVQKAEELQPDLILLDIGLPTLNGIEAARRIRKLSSQSKILFVSQESSADVVRTYYADIIWIALKAGWTLKSTNEYVQNIQPFIPAKSL